MVAQSVQSVITMANSIIGVSVLAMPFCFKQCGIILATIMILLSGLLVKMSCHLLVKSAIISRRRNYEILAFETFGAPGKMAVEVSMIGFMVGTCIAFFVVIGDLAPPIVASIFQLQNNEELRMASMLGLCLFVVLPLTLLRNMESLFAVSTASIAFYCCVMLHIIFSARQNIFDGSWTSDITWWRTAGIFQCLPIICMALSCQCQVFEIYESLPDPSLPHMNAVVRNAVNICSGVYIAVGLFGNIACSHTQLGGNILADLPPSSMVEIVKFGFVLSVAVSFPLVIFPCRTSIHSLIFKKGSSHSDFISSNYIPPMPFNVITIVIVTATLIMGILLPDIEFVLGIVGSTVGNVICIIFPAVIFIKLTSRSTTERLAAQAIFVLGIILMILGTYVNLYEADTKTTSKLEQIQPDPIPAVLVENQFRRVVDQDAFVDPKPAKIKEIIESVKETPVALDPVDVGPANVEHRHEPVEPVAPRDSVESAAVPDKPPDINAAAEKPAAGSEDEDKLKKYDTVGLKEAPGPVKHDPPADESLLEKQEKAERLLEELERQKNEQKQILIEQRQVLQELKHHAEEDKARAAAAEVAPSSSTAKPNLQPEVVVQPLQVDLPVKDLDPRQNELHQQPNVQAEQQLQQQKIDTREVQQQPLRVEQPYQVNNSPRQQQIAPEINEQGSPPVKLEAQKPLEVDQGIPHHQQLNEVQPPQEPIVIQSPAGQQMYQEQLVKQNPSVHEPINIVQNGIVDPNDEIKKEMKRDVEFVSLDRLDNRLCSNCDATRRMADMGAALQPESLQMVQAA